MSSKKSMRKAAAEVLTMRAFLKPAVTAALDSMHGEYTRDDAAEKLVEMMVDVDLNEFKKDVARALVDSEENGRSVKVPADGKGQLAFESLESAFFSDTAIYKLGDGLRIKTREAGMAHGLIHQGKLNEKAAETTAMSMRHNTFLIACQPYIEADPSLTLWQAWQMYLRDAGE